MSSTSISKAFADPVAASQQVFRQVLKAMSEPGCIATLVSVDQLPPLHEAAYSLVLALLDQATPLWLSPELDRPEIRDNLHFHTGVPISEEPEQCQFAIAYGGEIINLEHFPTGSAEYPETAATLIVQINAINEDSGEQLLLQGPGIPGHRQLQLDGLSPTLQRYLLARPDEFPRGLDLILVCQQRIVCIPRSTRVSLAPARVPEEAVSCM